MRLIPRLGQEALIGFLEGDPDCPILTGRVVNQTIPGPCRLPEHRAVSAWKSHTSLGEDGFNEVELEDERGEELVYLQAEKNLRQLVKHDETIPVLNDRDKHVVIHETDTTGIHRTDVTGVDPSGPRRVHWHQRRRRHPQRDSGAHQRRRLVGPSAGFTGALPRRSARHRSSRRSRSEAGLGGLALDAAERAEIDAAATVYLGAGKEWRPTEDRLEHRGASPDGKCWIVVAVHVGDEAALSPGGGKSLELWIDPTTKPIMKELGFQGAPASPVRSSRACSTARQRRGHPPEGPLGRRRWQLAPRGGVLFILEAMDDSRFA